MLWSNEVVAFWIGEQIYMNSENYVIVHVMPITLWMKIVIIRMIYLLNDKGK